MFWILYLFSWLHEQVGLKMHVQLFSSVFSGFHFFKSNQTSCTQKHIEISNFICISETMQEMQNCMCALLHQACEQEEKVAVGISPSVLFLLAQTGCLRTEIYFYPNYKNEKFLQYSRRCLQMSKGMSCIYRTYMYTAKRPTLTLSFLYSMHRRTPLSGANSQLALLHNRLSAIASWNSDW